MKDVIAVLGEGNPRGPVHVELVARGMEDAGLEGAADIGLKAITKALTSCPPLSAQYMGTVSVEVGSEDNSLTLSVRIGSVVVNVVIRAETERIGDNADITVIENLD